MQKIFLIDLEHGAIGTESRIEYEEGAQMFIVGEMLKEARKQSNMTQEQRAEKAGCDFYFFKLIQIGEIVNYGFGFSNILLR